MSAADDVDYVFHARELAKNPALRRAFDDERDTLVKEMNRLEPWQRDERWAVSVQISAVDNLERRLRRMQATAGRIEQFRMPRERSA